MIRIAFIKSGDGVEEFQKLGTIWKNTSIQHYMNEMYNIGKAHETLIITHGHRYARLKKDNFSVYTLPTNRGGKLNKLIKFGCPILILPLLFKFRPTLVVSLGSGYDFAPSYFYCIISNTKFIPAIRDEFRFMSKYFKVIKPGLYRWIDKFITSRILKDKRIDMILARSKHVKSELIKIGVNNSKIIVDYPKYSDVFFKLYKVEPIVEKKVFTILFVGRFANQKGIYELIETAKKVLKREKNLQFILIGDGPEFGSVKQKVQEYGINKWVHLLGYRDNAFIYSYLKNSDIFFLPSNHEGLGKVHIEGILAETPMVLTNIGSFTDFIEDGKTGLFVEPGDINGFVEAILKLYKNPKLREEIKENLKKLKKEVLNPKITFETAVKEYIKNKFAKGSIKNTGGIKMKRW